jgi:hypothetical protein
MNWHDNNFQGPGYNCIALHGKELMIGNWLAAFIAFEHSDGASSTGVLSRKELLHRGYRKLIFINTNKHSNKCVKDPTPYFPISSSLSRAWSGRLH